VAAFSSAVSRPSHERGTVVIVAMLIVALASIVASFALQRQDLALRQLEAARDYEQARWILRGGAHWARTILAEDARSGSVDHAGELWASGLPPTDIEQGTLSGEIRDAQGLFNLGNLLREGKPSERDVAAFKRLLAALGLRVELAEAIAAAQPFAEVGELRRVRGCDDAVVARLQPFVTVLPQRSAINVNTARAEVLMAAVEGLGLAEAAVLAQSAGAAPFRSPGDFRTRLPRPDMFVSDGDIAVRSGFFVVHGRARVGRADVRLEALLKREGTALPATVWLRTS
jgi:general secretion pathway protein K